MDHPITATEHSVFHWLTTDSVWDRDPGVYDMVARTARHMRWLSVTANPILAAAWRAPALDYLDTHLVAATGAAERTLWISEAKRYRTKPSPHALAGVRETTAEGTRSLLVLTGTETPVPVAVWEQALLGPAVATPCAAGAHRHCSGQYPSGNACGCRCGCGWPDRITAYRHLAVGDKATDPAWNWSFTVTSAPELDDTGTVALNAYGLEEQSADLLCRAPGAPVIVHNAWRPGRSEPPRPAT